MRVDENPDDDVSQERADFAERRTYRHGHAPEKKKIIIKKTSYNSRKIVFYNANGHSRIGTCVLSGTVLRLCSTLD